MPKQMPTTESYRENLRESLRIRPRRPRIFAPAWRMRMFVFSCWLSAMLPMHGAVPTASSRLLGKHGFAIDRKLFDAEWNNSLSGRKGIL